MSSNRHKTGAQASAKARTRTGARSFARVGAVAAVVLAGGAGRRMFPHSAGGGDKPLVALAGRPMVAHVVQRLKPQVYDLAIAMREGSRRAPADPALAGVAVVHDRAAEADGTGMGPLAGLLAGMEWARREAPYCPLLLSVPADVPFIPHDLAARMAAHLQAIEADVLTMRSRGRLHPTVALWSTELLAELRRAVLEEGVRKVEDFTRRHKHAELVWHLRGPDPFLNVNTPADLARAERRLAG
ncbi:MAG: molybdenum cofactor guanylyltransferase MobA [Reyranellaceae bacterium]